jgi:hypothetical protein
MTFLLIKAALSGIIVVAVSEVARRSPGLGGLIASLPLISILAMIWLWEDTADSDRIAAQSQATLVRAAVAAHVSGPSGTAQAWAGILARPRPFVPSDHGLLFSHDLGTLPAWRSSLEPGGACLPC